MKAVLITAATLAAIALTGIPAPAQNTAPVQALPLLAQPWEALRASGGTAIRSSVPLLAQPWEALLASELPRLGHRNFIVIADSAYPLQSAPGIRTVATG
ncbi:MAG: hypothetical protein MUF04_14880, partial [Akkermansiaceae bacterium]|nr:hypothetical protein [Akkermansiaceae bacterium]